MKNTKAQTANTKATPTLKPLTCKTLGQSCWLLLSFFILPSSFCLSALAQGTAFTYQGRLNDGANIANGIYDLRFAIYDAASGPAQVGSAPTNVAVTVSNVLFTVTLDFGPGVFIGKLH